LEIEIKLARYGKAALFRLAKNCAEIYNFSKLPEIVPETVNLPISGSLNFETVKLFLKF
jgi:hypothetical protein